MNTISVTSLVFDLSKFSKYNMCIHLCGNADGKRFLFCGN